MRVQGDTAGVNPERIEYLTRRQGLLSDEVRALFQDRNGSLWIGSRRGLSRLSESNIRAVLNRGDSDGFVAAVTVARDGAVWTATATGLTRRRGTVGAHLYRTRRPARSNRHRAPRRHASAPCGPPRRLVWRGWSGSGSSRSRRRPERSGVDIRFARSHLRATARCGCAIKSAASFDGRTESIDSLVDVVGAAQSLCRACGSHRPGLDRLLGRRALGLRSRSRRRATPPSRVFRRAR